MNILIVSAEVSPFAKVGGLADVAGALPKDLIKLGHDVRVAMPAYPMIVNNPKYDVKSVIKKLEVPLADGSTCSGYVKSTKLDKAPVYLVGSDEHFCDATESKKIYSAGWDSYAFFCKGVLEMVKALDPKWVPDVIHINDWHTGLLPVYLKVSYASDPVLSSIATVCTIHNLAYQGEFEYDVLAQAGLPGDLYTTDKLECYGKVNFLKAGLVFSDLVNTVSETYACEIQTPEYGCRLEGFLRHLAFQNRLRGILNGIDYTIFDPAKDSRIKANFKRADTAGKAACKTALQKGLGLAAKKDVPVIGMVTRLADQKGLDLVKSIMAKFTKTNAQLVVLGTGDPVYEKFFASQVKKSPSTISATIGFDATLAQKIYAGCDMFLMPSRFEPCGLGQMISLRYGTIPIVRRTGGLGDTITEFDAKAGAGNGFVFDSYDVKELWSAMQRALTTYSDAKSWKKLVDNAMKCDFSTKKCAKDYEALYSDAVNSRQSNQIAA